MPSKKKLRKQNRALKKRFRKLEDWSERIYSSFQRVGREAWEAREARDKAVRDLRRLQNAARELLDTIDNGRQDDIPNRKDAVRDLLPGEPWTLSRVRRLRDKFRGMSATCGVFDEARDWTDDLPDEAPKLIEDEEVPPAFKQPDWSKVLDSDTYAGFTTTADGKPVPLVSSPTEQGDPLNSGGQTYDMGPRPTISRDTPVTIVDKAERKPRTYTDEDHQVWADSDEDAA
ncbi:hypothetical protein [Nocardia africana]